MEIQFWFLKWWLLQLQATDASIVFCDNFIAVFLLVDVWPELEINAPV